MRIEIGVEEIEASHVWWIWHLIQACGFPPSKLTTPGKAFPTLLSTTSTKDHTHQEISRDSILTTPLDAIDLHHNRIPVTVTTTSNPSTDMAEAHLRKVGRSTVNLVCPLIQSF